MSGGRTGEGGPEDKVGFGRFSLDLVRFRPVRGEGRTGEPPPQSTSQKTCGPVSERREEERRGEKRTGEERRERGEERREEKRRGEERRDDDVEG